MARKESTVKELKEEARGLHGLPSRKEFLTEALMESLFGFTGVGIASQITKGQAKRQLTTSAKEILNKRAIRLDFLKGGGNPVELAMSNKALSRQIDTLPEQLFKPIDRIFWKDPRDIADMVPGKMGTKTLAQHAVYDQFKPPARHISFNPYHTFRGPTGKTVLPHELTHAKQSIKSAGAKRNLVSDVINRVTRKAQNQFKYSKYYRKLPSEIHANRVADDVLKYMRKHGDVDYETYLKIYDKHLAKVAKSLRKSVPKLWKETLTEAKQREARGKIKWFGE
jgi:CRISPR/Cas system CMR-associated protein Cmr5 small subunit